MLLFNNQKETDYWKLDLLGLIIMVVETHKINCLDLMLKKTVTKNITFDFIAMFEPE